MGRPRRRCPLHPRDQLLRHQHEPQGVRHHPRTQAQGPQKTRRIQTPHQDHGGAFRDLGAHCRTCRDREGGRPPLFRWYVVFQPHRFHQQGEAGHRGRGPHRPSPGPFQHPRMHHQAPHIRRGHRRKTGTLHVHRPHPRTQRYLRGDNRGQDGPQEELPLRDAGGADPMPQGGLLRQDPRREERADHQGVHDNRKAREPHRRPFRGRGPRTCQGIHRGRCRRHNDPQQEEIRRGHQRVLHPVPQGIRQRTHSPCPHDIQPVQGEGAHGMGSEHSHLRQPYAQGILPRDGEGRQHHPRERKVPRDRRHVHVDKGHTDPHPGAEAIR